MATKEFCDLTGKEMTGNKPRKIVLTRPRADDPKTRETAGSLVINTSPACVHDDVVIQALCEHYGLQPANGARAPTK